ncbi:MAG: cell division protein FtsH, partial [Arcobacteraceae bacterium]|nr:cell division protein FtsH [Arcobacteraceae bacterium]
MAKRKDNNQNNKNEGNNNNFFNNNPLLVFVLFSIVTIFVFKTLFPQNETTGPTNGQIQSYGTTQQKTVPYSELKKL